MQSSCTPVPEPQHSGGNCANLEQVSCRRKPETGTPSRSNGMAGDSLAGGRTSYRNASNTLRRGAEVSLDTDLQHGLSVRLALGAALETIANGKVYALVNLRLQARQDRDRWRFKEFLRLNNMFDRNYIGSVIVGDTNKRFYEAAPGRQWMAGLTAEYRF